MAGCPSTVPEYSGVGALMFPRPGVLMMSDLHEGAELELGCDPAATSLRGSHGMLTK